MLRRVTHVLALAEKPGRVVWGGAERHLRVLLPGLARCGVDVEAIVLATSPGALVEDGLREWRAAGVRVRVLSRRSRQRRLANVAAFAWQHLRLWRALRDRRDRIVHVHLDELFMIAAALLARCPEIVMTLHNDKPLPGSRLLRWLKVRWLRFVAAQCAGFIAISRHVAEHFRRSSDCPEGKLHVIEYGLAVNASPVSRERLGWPRDRFMVGFLGRLAPQKNLFVLLEALALCPEIDAVIVGNGPLRDALERFVAARRLANVCLEGAIENASELIPLFDVLCLPSIWEGLGLVLVEAMLHKVPVVGSRAGAIPDVVGYGRYGLLFDTDDPADLARALRHARDRAGEMAELAEGAYHYARARFSVATMAERTDSFYGRIVGRGLERETRPATLPNRAPTVWT